MKFIKLEYIDEAIELINLSKVNLVKPTELNTQATLLNLGKGS